MWTVPKGLLYENVDVNSGLVQGFNRDVLTNLIKFYILTPSLTENDVDNSQHLGPKKYAQNFDNDYNRNYIHNTHRHVFSRRPRHFKKPDKELWEKLFRNRHPTESFALGNRERDWYRMAKYEHMGKMHWHPEFRHLDYYLPAYQPSKFRPEGKKKGHGLDKVKKVFPPVLDE